MCARQRRNLAAEIADRPVYAFAERIAHEAADLDRRADLAFALFDRLRHAFLIVENEALIEQADFLVEGFEPRRDDLVDDGRGLALGFELLRQHILLALDDRHIEPG